MALSFVAVLRNNNFILGETEKFLYQPTFDRFKEFEVFGLRTKLLGKIEGKQVKRKRDV